MVFAILLVTAVVVADVGIGRQRVQKVEVFWFLAHVVVTFNKEEFSHLSGTVDEDTALTSSVVATDRVVFAVFSCVIDGILIEVGHRVQFYGRDVAQ